MFLLCNNLCYCSTILWSYTYNFHEFELLGKKVPRLLQRSPHWEATKMLPYRFRVLGELSEFTDPLTLSDLYEQRLSEIKFWAIASDKGPEFYLLGSGQWAVLCVSHPCPTEDTGSSSLLLSSLSMNRSKKSGKALNTCACYTQQPLHFVQIKETNKLLGSDLCTFVRFLVSVFHWVLD